MGSERHGLELTGYYQIGNSWSVDLEYAYANSRFETPIDGFDDIPGALEHVVSGGIGTILVVLVIARIFPEMGKLKSLDAPQA